jgi:hypothetical protein
MKQEFNEQLEQIIAHLGDSQMAKSVREMPLAAIVGDVLTLTGETKVIPTELKTRDGQSISYGAFLTVEGFKVPFGQIARRNNGLGLVGDTRAECIREFAAKIPDEGLKLKVVKVKKVESSFDDSKQSYVMFEYV